MEFNMLSASLPYLVSISSLAANAEAVMSANFLVYLALTAANLTWSSSFCLIICFSSCSNCFFISSILPLSVSACFSKSSIFASFLFSSLLTLMSSRISSGFSRLREASAIASFLARRSSRDGSSATVPASTSIPKSVL